MTGGDRKRVAESYLASTAGRKAGDRAGHPGSKGRAGLGRGALWEVDAAPGWVGELRGRGREGCTAWGEEKHRCVGWSGREGRW